jgi:hypothetical protein
MIDGLPPQVAQVSGQAEGAGGDFTNGCRAESLPTLAKLSEPQGDRLVRPGQRLRGNRRQVNADINRAIRSGGGTCAEARRLQVGSPQAAADFMKAGASFGRRRCDAGIKPQ